MPTALVISTATRSDRAAETLKVIRDEVKRMAEKGVTEEELAAAKKYIIGAYAINNLDSSVVDRQHAGRAADSTASASTISQRRADLINDVTLDEVQAAARKLLSAEPAVMMLGPALKDGGKG